jgi:hypothetical protein
LWMDLTVAFVVGFRCMGSVGKEPAGKGTAGRETVGVLCNR